jgi:DNA-binding NarL/FixJ family response regulator
MADVQPLLNVFLIEDSPILRQMLVEMLEDIEDTRVVGVADGESAALEGLAQKPADLVIVDLELREGSGLRVLQELRNDPERYHRPGTVVFSNHAHEQMRRRCEALGIQAFFDKSMQVGELIDFVKGAQRPR